MGPTGAVDTLAAAGVDLVRGDELGEVIPGVVVLGKVGELEGMGISVGVEGMLDWLGITVLSIDEVESGGEKVSVAVGNIIAVSIVGKTSSVEGITSFVEGITSSVKGKTSSVEGKTSSVESIITEVVGVRSLVANTDSEKKEPS